MTSMLHSLTTNFSFLAEEMTLPFSDTAVTKNLPAASDLAPDVAFGNLITHLLNIILTVGMIAVLLFLLWGAIEWITAGGDSGKITKAREKITGALIGIIVLISTTAILLFVQQLIGICIINFGNSC